MNRLESVEDQVKQLPAEELRQLRTWFAEFDAERWDAQFEADVRAGKLDRLAERALKDHSAGRSSEL